MADAGIDYGIDAPGLVRFFAASGLASVVVAGVAWMYLTGFGSWAIALPVAVSIIAVYLLGMASLMIVWSKVIKVRERERLFDRILWRGDEAVLDIGCGRGLMLIGAAQRLSSGYAVGIDIWAASDQSTNSAIATLRNAEIVGVRDRTSVETADMRALPFDDSRFDRVVSHWAVHNLDAASDRDTALAEMVRVLRPEGVLVLADIAHRQDFAGQLVALGLGAQEHFGSRTRDVLLRFVSFGSFRPYAIIARRA